VNKGHSEVCKIERWQTANSGGRHLLMKTCYQPSLRTQIVYYTKDIDKHDLKSYSLVLLILSITTGTIPYRFTSKLMSQNKNQILL
jgi:hypothetical protein